MEITKGIWTVNLGLWVKKHKFLVFSDFHMGFEESLNQQGVLIPRFQFKDTIKRLEVILSKVKPEIIMLNGDVKHEFGRISEQEWRETIKLIEFLSKHCNKLIIGRGNHDKIIGPIAEKKGIEIVDNFIIGDILVTHGDKIPSKLITRNSKLKTIIIGHEHPAISLNEGVRKEKFKCFAVGKYKGKNLIVQPSFNLVTEGTDLLRDKTLSPFLKQNINDFKIYIVADRVYEFGKIKNLKD